MSLGVVLGAIALGACGSPASQSGAGTPPPGQALMFRDGWNFVALGQLDTVSSTTVATNCVNDVNDLSFPDEPSADIGHFATEAADAHKWRAGCEAAAGAIKELGRTSLADGGSTALTPYPPPAEQHELG